MKKIFTNFLLLVTFSLASVNLSAQTYLINDSDEYEVMNRWSSSKTKDFTISNPLPCDQLTFNYSTGTWPTGGVDVTATYSDGSSEKIISAGNGNPQSKALNRKVVKSLSFKGTGTVKKYISNVKLTAASYADAPAASTWTAPTAKIGSPDESASTTMEWSNTSAFTLSISGDGASQFTYNITNNAAVGKYGTATISVTYNHNIVGTHNATLTISTAFGTHTIVLSGTTTKKDQTIAWANEYNDGKLPVGKIVNNAATATSGQTIIYESSDNNVIKIINDGTAFQAIAVGSATITAKQAGDNTEWNGISSTKTFTVTEKIIQSIHWTDNLTRLKVGGDNVMLSATAMILTNAETNEYTESPERAELLTFASNNTDVVTIVGNVLTIVGEGETTVSASLPGDEYYEAITIEMPVKVSALSSLCEAYVLDDAKERELNTVDSEEYSINGPAHQLTFTANRTALWGFTDGNLKVDAYYNGEWHKIFDEDVTKDNYKSYGPITLDRNTTKLKFYTTTGATGYKHIKDVLVTQATYLETTTPAVVVEKSIIGDVIEKSIQVQYSNLPEGVLISNTSDKITLSTAELDSDCGKYGEQTINLTIVPTEVGTIEDVITIEDEATKLSLNIPVTIHTQRNTQTIIWNDEVSSIYTTDNITFSAEAKTAITYESSDNNIAEVQNNQLIIKTSGVVTITATAAQDEKYEQATATKTITISKATPVLEELPIATSITYGSTLGTSILEGGSTNVDGTWEWNADVAQVLNAGINDISVLFTPANTAWYSLLEVTVSLTVNKADQTLAWDFADQELIAGSTLTLNATATCGDVTYTLSDNDGVVTLDGTTLTAHKVGTVTLQASHAGDANHNAVASAIYTITVVHATPVVTEWPTLAAVTYGATLEHALTLVGGEASVDGEFVLTKPTDLTVVPSAGNHDFVVTFVPTDSKAYASLADTVVLTVNQASQEISWGLGNISLAIGEEIVLDATASSNLAVSYVIEGDANIVVIEEEIYLVAQGEGTVTITAVQEGNNDYLAAETISYVINVYDPSGETTNLDNVISPATTTTKCIIDGRLYIVRDGKYYDAAGRMVK